MRKRIIVEYEVFESTTFLPAPFDTLMSAAKAALEKSYSPYSEFRVGAAVLLENGEIVNGANFENASYPLCLCAERVALAACYSIFPTVPVIAIAVTAQNASNPVLTPPPPCGACRQVLAEFETRFGNKVKVISAGETGEAHLFHSAKDLLPFSFDKSFL